MQSTPALINGFLAATSPLSSRYRVGIVLVSIYSQGLYLLPNLSDPLAIDRAMTRVVSAVLGVGGVSGAAPVAFAHPPACGVGSTPAPTSH